MPEELQCELRRLMDHRVGVAGRRGSGGGVPHYPLARETQRLGLRQRLDTLVETFDISTITPDPLELPLRYRNPLDQEVAALLAAAFAYGRADIVVANVSWILERMAPSPYEYLHAFDRDEVLARFAGFAHRFHKTPELVALLGCIAVAIAKHGSIGELFRLCYDDADRDIGPSLARFVNELRGAPACHSERRRARGIPCAIATGIPRCLRGSG